MGSETTSSTEVSTGFILFLSGLAVVLSALRNHNKGQQQYPTPALHVVPPSTPVKPSLSSANLSAQGSATVTTNAVKLRVEAKEDETVITATPQIPRAQSAAGLSNMIVGPARDTVEKKAPGLRGKILAE